MKKTGPLDDMIDVVDTILFLMIAIPVFFASLVLTVVDLVEDIVEHFIEID